MAASANDIDTESVGAHSLSSGGSGAMFVAGYDAELIKRRGGGNQIHFPCIFGMVIWYCLLLGKVWLAPTGG